MEDCSVSVADKNEFIDYEARINRLTFNEINFLKMRFCKDFSNQAIRLHTGWSIKQIKGVRDGICKKYRIPADGLEGKLKDRCSEWVEQKNPEQDTPRGTSENVVYPPVDDVHKDMGVTDTSPSLRYLKKNTGTKPPHKTIQLPIEGISASQQEGEVSLVGSHQEDVPPPIHRYPPDFVDYVCRHYKITPPGEVKLLREYFIYGLRDEEIKDKSSSYLSVLRSKIYAKIGVHSRKGMSSFMEKHFREWNSENTSLPQTPPPQSELEVPVVVDSHQEAVSMEVSIPEPLSRPITQSGTKDESPLSVGEQPDIELDLDGFLRWLRIQARNKKMTSREVVITLLDQLPIGIESFLMSTSATLDGVLGELEKSFAGLK